MIRALFVILAVSLAAPALALGYVPGDPNVPVFSAVGTSPPQSETPTNHSMVQASPIAQPARQTGPAAMNQTFTGTVSGLTLTLGSTISAVLPPSTQITGTGIVGAANGNFPVIVGPPTTGTGLAIGSTYTLNNSTAVSTGSISITAEPLDLNEDAIAAWYTSFHQNFDSGFASGCLHDVAISGIDHVNFRLNGTQTITANSTTTNSDTGAPDYCWAAPVSLFAGHNGVQQVDAVVFPVAGWPVAMQSAQAVSVPASSSTFVIQGWTPVHIGLPGAAIAHKWVQVTNSSDTATFPNASTFNNVNQVVNFGGVYCVLPTDADHYQLEEASFTIKAGVGQGGVQVFSSACNIQETGSIASGVMTLTGAAANQPGGQIIVGQTVSCPGCGSSVTVTSVDGSNCSVGCNVSNGSLTVAGPITITMAGAIPATGSGATFTLTPLHAGGTNEQGANHSTGSDFFTVNPPGTSQSIPEATAFASVGGLTLGQALASVTPTNGNNVPALVGAPVQTIGSAGGCTTFTRTGNVTGAAPYLINEPVKVDVVNSSSGVFVMGGVYFVSSQPGGEAITLSATPGGACINDTSITITGSPSSCSGAGLCVAIYADYSLTTLYLQHTGAANSQNFFGLGDGAAIMHFADIGFLTVAWDPATANFDDVAINSEGTSSSNGSNDSLGGLGVDNLHSMVKGVLPSTTLHLTQRIAKGSTITGLTVSQTELAAATAAGFLIVPATQTHQGSETTQVIDGGNCLPSTGGAAAQVNVITVSSAPTTDSSGTVTTIPLAATGGIAGGFTAFNDCPVGTPIQLVTVWQYRGSGNMWLDHGSMIGPNPQMNTSGGNAGVQIAAGNWTGEVTATEAGVFNLGQGVSNSSYVANTLIVNALSKCIQGIFTAVFDTCVSGGDISVTRHYNQSTGFNAFGVASDVVNDSATINGTISGSTLTVNSVSSGTPVPGMLVTYSGAPTTLVAAIQTSPTTFTLTSAPTAVGPITMVLQRSFWQIAPKGNTTPGNIISLPQMTLNDSAIWSCQGGTVSTGTERVIWWYDETTSNVIVSGQPSGSCPLAGGQSLFSFLTGFHQDMFATNPGGNNFEIGMVVYGLNFVNSQGFEWGPLNHNVNDINMSWENSNQVVFTVVGSTYNAIVGLASGDTRRNVIFRDTNVDSIAAGSITGVVNGTFVWDGVNCTGSNCIGFETNLIPTQPGTVVRNSGWPGQGAAPNGNF